MKACSPLLFLLTLSLPSGPARANSLERALVSSVARVSADEGALQNPREVSLVWQVVEGHGKTTWARLTFLRRHSPHVLGLKPCGRLLNCYWARQLDWSGDEPPAMLGQGVAPDFWRVVTWPCWHTIQHMADALVHGRVHDRPCSRTPTTWGSRTSRRDLAYAHAHGLCALGCANTLNDGFAPCGDLT